MNIEEFVELFQRGEVVLDFVSEVEPFREVLQELTKRGIKYESWNNVGAKAKDADISAPTPISVKAQTIVFEPLFDNQIFMSLL